jgi:ubiquinone/menaquinone biosynthesis C-methylase UbiE
MRIKNCRFKRSWLSGMESILDAGCGNGTMLPRALDAVRLDFSKRTLKLAKQNVDRGDFVCATIDNLPFKDKTFDKVLCYSMMLLVPDFRATERELRRVTRKKLLIGDCRMVRPPRKLGDLRPYLFRVKESVQTGTWVR